MSSCPWRAQRIYRCFILTSVFQGCVLFLVLHVEPLSGSSVIYNRGSWTSGWEEPRLPSPGRYLRAGGLFSPGVPVRQFGPHQALWAPTSQA